MTSFHIRLTVASGGESWMTVIVRLAPAWRVERTLILTTRGMLLLLLPTLMDAGVPVSAVMFQMVVTSLHELLVAPKNTETIV